jgi:metal-responsive CopG/Arc/MetJ family transcriptional regulator
MLTGMKVKKVTVSIPADLFEWEERERQKLNIGRSEFVSKILEDAYRRQENEERIRRYEKAYAECPSTPAEDWLLEEGTNLLFEDTPG